MFRTAFTTNSVLLLFAALLASVLGQSAGSDAVLDKLAHLYVWPLSASSPVPLARLSYSTRTQDGRLDLRGTQAVNTGDDEAVRVGVQDETTGTWFGTITSGRLLKEMDKATVTLKIDYAGKPWHVDYKVHTDATAATVMVEKASPGVLPHFNKPVVLTADGKLPEKEVEKTFLQKYWWLLLGALILVLGGGGGGEGQ